ncbi:MBL fold metallo-hydrolase [Vagococcus hydrophili]|uniref:MBL fold metallo-hydrolase n=1 Tax=Vagococcus hydrophili TaxID=2714947 RepID=A0A6G8AQ07_9ENTE|nr:MBL fold metallo-hydrolase [Vagococcus hydrophili]QIL47060.1 MBL fold metallo-hydrolase [Vagococcus hydrophili]
MISIKSFGSSSDGNGYLIDDGNSQLLIECGVSLKKILPQMKHNLTKVAGLLVSHEHRDHCKYIKKIVDETAFDIFSTKGTREAMFEDEVLRLEKTDRYRFNTMKYKETVTIGTWEVTPFKLQHDVREPSGFMIDNTAGDRLIFITDSYYIKYQFPNVTHIMIEMNYEKETMKENLAHDKKRQERLLESHFDYKRAIQFIQNNKSTYLQEVWLLHLSDSNSNEKLFKEETQKVVGVPVYVA